MTGRGHLYETPQTNREIAVDPERVLGWAAWARTLQDFETQLMSGFSHLRLRYDRDLSEFAAQQATADKVAAWLDIDRSNVAPRLHAISKTVTISNADEISEAMAAQGF